MTTTPATWTARDEREARRIAESVDRTPPLGRPCSCRRCFEMAVKAGILAERERCAAVCREWAAYFAAQPAGEPMQECEVLADAAADILAGPGDER